MIKYLVCVDEVLHQWVGGGKKPTEDKYQGNTRLPGGGYEAKFLMGHNQGRLERVEQRKGAALDFLERGPRR